jgi:hypothetical protein
LPFANITRPGIRLKEFLTLFVEIADALSRFPRVTVDGILTLLVFSLHSRICPDNWLAVFGFALAYSMAASGR